MSVSQEFRVALAVALIGAAASVWVGLRSDISLGDEVYHFYMAKRWVESGHRPIDEPQIHASPVARRKYMAMPLWHAGLAAVWAVTGIRQDVAQVYQGAWYVALVLATYDVGRRLYQRRVGLWAAVLAATMPFAGAYTSMLYVDVAVAVMATLVLSCLVRRRFLAAGVVLSLAFWIKQNAYFLVPGVVVAVVLLARGTWRRRLAWAAVCVLLAAGLHIPELAWRRYHLGSVIYHPPGPKSVLMRDVAGQAPQLVEGIPVVAYRFVHPSDFIRNPLLLVQHLGVPLLGGVAFAAVGGVGNLLRRRRPTAKAPWQPTRAWILWLPSLMYLPLFLYLFRHDWGVRYLSPILPVLCLIAARALSSIRPRGVKGVVAVGVLIVGVGQFAAAEAYLYGRRLVKPDMAAAYRWIALHTDPNAGILCQNAVLAPMTGRRAIWHSEASLPEIGYLLWMATEHEAHRILRRYAVDYIFVELPRVYDDCAERRLPGWPQSFVDKLEAWPCMVLVFRNTAAAIWRVSETAPSSTAPSSAPGGAGAEGQAPPSEGAGRRTLALAEGPVQPGESDCALDACAPGGVESHSRPGVGARMP